MLQTFQEVVNDQIQFYANDLHDHVHRLCLCHCHDYDQDDHNHHGQDDRSHGHGRVHDDHIAKCRVQKGLKVQKLFS